MTAILQEMVPYNKKKTDNLLVSQGVCVCVGKKPGLSVPGSVFFFFCLSPVGFPSMPKSAAKRHHS